LKWKNGTSPAWTEIIDSESLKSVNINGGTLVLEGVCAECSAEDK
jgi:hypothetical protein